MSKNNIPSQDTVIVDNPSANSNPDTSSATKSDTEEEKVTLTKQEFDTLNKRLQDNRDSFLQTNQKLKETELVNRELNSKLVSLNSSAAIPADEQARLDDLKFSDPDSWYKEMVALDKTNQTNLQKSLEQINIDAQTQARKLTEQEQLAEFKHDLNLVPYQLRMNYESGKIDLPTFLADATEFFGASKVVKNEEVPTTPNLNKATGASDASLEAKSNAVSQDYETQTF